MGCAASTTIATGEEANATLKQQKNSEDVTLTRAAADSGDLSIKDANIFGDQLDLHKKVNEEDTNFHNSPSNIMNEPVSVISNNIEISTNPGRISADSSLSRNEEVTKTKDAENTKGDDQFLMTSDTKVFETHDEATSEKELTHSGSTSRQSQVFKPTINSSDDEESRMSTKISQDLSKQNEDSAHSKTTSSIPENRTTNTTTNNSDNTLSKDPSTEKSDNEKSGKFSRSSDTLTGPKRSPFVDYVNANVGNENINQNHDVIQNNEITLMGTGDVNQNHQLITMSLISDYCRNECISIQNEKSMNSYHKDLSATGDIGLERLDPSFDENNTLDFGINELQNEHSKNMSLSRTSQISAISRQSTNTPSFNHGYLKTAEVNDTNFEIESLNAFEMKDMTVDYNQAENEIRNLSECNNDIVQVTNTDDKQANHLNDEE